jgi:hypothetical protein
MTNAEKIADLASKLESSAREDMRKEMIGELRGYLKVAPAAEKLGVAAAIEYLSENF